MAPSRIGIYTLGHTGVIVDPNFLEPLLSDDSMQFAQNATHEPQAEHGGGIRKRQGLQQFNAVSLGGAILGGIPMPVAGTGGAPAPAGTTTIDDPADASGTDGTGSSVGTGNGTGAPGATSDGGAASTSGSSGASAFGGGAAGSGTVFSGRRLLIIGRDDGTNGGQIGEGWYKTSALYGTDTPVSLTSPGPPSVPQAPGLVPAGDPDGDGNPGAVGDNMGVWLGSWYYFAQVIPLSTDDRITVQRTNGVQVQAAFSIPKNPNSVANVNGSSDQRQFQNVISFHAGSNGLLYVCVIDKYVNTGASHPGKAQSVYAWDPVGQTLAVIAQTLGATGDRIISQAQLFNVNVGGALGSAGPYLFTGDFVGAVDTAATVSAWLPLGFKNTGLGVEDYAGVSTQDAITCMAQYNGRLWAGSRCNSAAPALPYLISRDPNQALGSATAWTTYSGTTVGLPSIASSNLSFYSSMVVMPATAANGNVNYLCLAYFNQHTSTAYIFTAVANNYGALNSAMTFAQVFSVAASAPITLNVDSGILFAIWTKGLGNGSKIYSSVDTVTWDAGTTLGTLSNSSYSLAGLFLGLNQT